MEVILEFMERLEEKETLFYRGNRTISIGVEVKDIHKIAKEMREENGW